MFKGETLYTFKITLYLPAGCIIMFLYRRFSPKICSFKMFSGKSQFTRSEITIVYTVCSNSALDIPNKKSSFVRLFLAVLSRTISGFSATKNQQTIWSNFFPCRYVKDLEVITIVSSNTVQLQHEYSITAKAVPWNTVKEKNMYSVVRKFFYHFDFPYVWHTTLVVWIFTSVNANFTLWLTLLNSSFKSVC